jgi:hypothetical protein
VDEKGTQTSNMQATLSSRRRTDDGKRADKVQVVNVDTELEHKMVTTQIMRRKEKNMPR